MPRPNPLVALHGAVDFTKLIPFDAAANSAPLGVNDILVMRRAAGGPNVLVTVGDVQAHGGAVDISDLTGGANDDMLFRIAGIWTGTGSTGLSYNGSLLAIPIGSAAAPTLVGVGSLTTGIFYPGVGIWGVAVAGVEKMRAKSTGIDITGNCFLLGSGRPGLVNSGGGAGVPTVVPDAGDLDTGHGTQGSTNNLASIVGGTRAVAWRHTGAGNGAIEYTADVTIGNPASTTQAQGNGTQNSAEWSRTTTVANPDDVITLGSATEGRKTLVTNRGANRLQIFPALGQNLGEGVNVSMFLEVGESTTFFAIASGIWQRIAGIGSTGAATSFPEFQFTPSILENPNNADWAVNALAPAIPDGIDNDLTVREFDDTTEEGTGFGLQVPSGATNIVIGLLSRAQTPAGAARTVGVNLYQRGVPDGAAAEAWDAGTQLDDVDVPNSTFWQADSQTITLASLGITAGEFTHFELTRVNPTGGTELVGNWLLLQIRISFT